MMEYVQKRDGTREPVSMDKISARLLDIKLRTEASSGETLDVNLTKIARRTVMHLYDGISTSEIETCAADTCAQILDDPDYVLFAGYILMSDHASSNQRTFREYLDLAYTNLDSVSCRPAPLLSETMFETGMRHADRIEAAVDHELDILYDYFAAQTLLRGRYLLGRHGSITSNRVKTTGFRPFETPQYMWMRVAFGINGDDVDGALALYRTLSRKQAILATPTLFNAGTPTPQMSSCFLVDMKEDSIDGIYDTLKQCAIISKYAGGVGLAINKIRSAGSYITSTNGTSNGVVPMLKVYNSTARYCDQGGGKRKGSFAVYMSPHHADILQWLDLKRPNGSGDERSRDLFYGLWVSDLFMQRVVAEFGRAGGEPVLWSLFDPGETPELGASYGAAFEGLYTSLEAAGRYVRQIPIRELWTKILETQIETGTPYVLFKDHCNRKSNQQNLGTIQSSNLCAEIIEYTSPSEVAVCNLASVSLPSFVDSDCTTFDYAELHRVSRRMVRNLDKVIDTTFYPVPEARVSNTRHRPVGLGIQGLANVFSRMSLAFDSPEAAVINRRIAETMYHAALTESHALAVEKGAYPSIDENGGAPVRQGRLQQDLWDGDLPPPDEVLAFDWHTLRTNIKRDGVRNSLLVAHMPTASTSQILGNVESFEPFFAHVFTRKTKAGEFFCYNRDLVRDLKACGAWTVHTDPETREESVPMMQTLLRNAESIQSVDSIPLHVRRAHRTLRDLSLNTLTLMARDRCIYVDQSSSLNVHYRNADNMMVPMTKYLCYAWKLGLKTGCYYTRTIQSIDALDFTGRCTEDVCTSCSA